MHVSPAPTGAEPGDVRPVQGGPRPQPLQQVDSEDHPTKASVTLASSSDGGTDAPAAFSAAAGAASGLDPESSCVDSDSEAPTCRICLLPAQV